MGESPLPSQEYSSRAPSIARTLDQLPELEVLYRRFISNIRDNEARAAIDQAEQQIPAVDATTIAVLGIPPADIVPQTMHQAPVKEGRPNVSEQYQVAQQSDGSLVFIKDVPMKAIPGINRRSKINDLCMLVYAQAEVFASRLADAIGYPMPHTELARYEDKAVLVSAYQPGDDHSPGAGLRYKGNITNPEAITNRPIFNALLGQHISSSEEGIVNRDTGKYYAIDVALKARGDDLSITPDEMQQRLTELNNGQPFQFTESAAGYIQNLAAALQDGAIQRIFRDAIGSDGVGQTKAQEVEARAHAILKLASTQPVREVG